MDDLLFISLFGFSSCIISQDLDAHLSVHRA